MISETTKPGNFFKFESLRIYHKSIDFANAILSLSDACQTDAQKMLCDLFFKEAMNISNCLIRGTAGTRAEFIDDLQEAKVSIGKCVALCTLAGKQNLADETQESDIRNELMELTKMIGALILSFQKHDSANALEPNE